MKNAGLTGSKRHVVVTELAHQIGESQPQKLLLSAQAVRAQHILVFCVVLGGSRIVSGVQLGLECCNKLACTLLWLGEIGLSGGWLHR